MSKLMYLAIGALVVAAGAAIVANSMAPRQTPGHAMFTPDLSEIEDGAAIAEVVVPAQFSLQAQMGERGFNAVCAACHGENAAGINGIAPPLVHIFYESTHHGDAAFFSAVQNGVQAHHWEFGDMAPVKGLTKADIGNIVAYVRGLQRANGIN
ncbi:MAG: cytochrome c [Pseudorhodobacter sp.]|nr:cytochrome c [Pseudorhodobacter sp.]